MGVDDKVPIELSVQDWKHVEKHYRDKEHTQELWDKYKDICHPCNRFWQAVKEVIKKNE